MPVMVSAASHGCHLWLRSHWVACTLFTAEQLSPRCRQCGGMAYITTAHAPEMAQLTGPKPLLEVAPLSPGGNSSGGNLNCMAGLTRWRRVGSPQRSVFEPRTVNLLICWRLSSCAVVVCKVSFNVCVMPSRTQICMRPNLLVMSGAGSSTTAH